MNQERFRRWGIALQIRTGVNTGEVLAGTPIASQELMVGDAVNMDARLKQAASPGEVLLGPRTYRLVRHAVRAQSIEPLTLKGKSEPVPAYRLLEVLPRAEAVARRFNEPMIGRGHQVRLLREAFEATVADSSCRLVTILGPAGLGKSRLVE